MSEVRGGIAFRLRCTSTRQVGDGYLGAGGKQRLVRCARDQILDIRGGFFRQDYRISTDFSGFYLGKKNAEFLDMITKQDLTQLHLGVESAS